MTSASLGSITRGCGKRVKGSIYLEVPTSPFGQPLEYFLIDPPIAVDTEAWGVTPRGVTLRHHEETDTYHVLDWVGSEHYPNVADVLEEGRRFGFSRRVSPGLDFSKLTADSRLLLLHARAIVEPLEPYYQTAVRDLERSNCPKGLTAHNPFFNSGDANLEMCAGLWWHDIQGGERIQPYSDEDFSVKRTMPSFSYTGYEAPYMPIRASHLGMIAALPLGRIAVINDPADPNGIAKLQEKVSQAHIPTVTEDE